MQLTKATTSWRASTKLIPSSHCLEYSKKTSKDTHTSKLSPVTEGHKTPKPIPNCIMSKGLAHAQNSKVLVSHSSSRRPKPVCEEYFLFLWQHSVSFCRNSTSHDRQKSSQSKHNMWNFPYGKFLACPSCKVIMREKTPFSMLTKSSSFSPFLPTPTSRGSLLVLLSGLMINLSTRVIIKKEYQPFACLYAGWPLLPEKTFHM